MNIKNKLIQDIDYLLSTSDKVNMYNRNLLLIECKDNNKRFEQEVYFNNDLVMVIRYNGRTIIDLKTGNRYTIKDFLDDYSKKMDSVYKLVSDKEFTKIILPETPCNTPYLSYDLCYIPATSGKLYKIEKNRISIIDLELEDFSHDTTSIYYDGKLGSVYGSFFSNDFIIKDNKIVAASVYYELTTRPLSGNYGTRHRAALGIAEVTDSITIVVSEETGKISITYSGIIITISDRDKS
mgnify:CR=1 FL=1